jgi:hypothetical protein
MSDFEDFDIKLEELRKLDPNWDGYNGIPPSKEAISAAKRFMDSLFIVPSTDGGVQLEWHVHDVDLEIFLNLMGPLRISHSIIHLNSQIK